MIPVLITNPRSGTHYLKALIASSLRRAPVERCYETAGQLTAALAGAQDNQLIYGHFAHHEFGRALHPGNPSRLRLILLTRHPIDRLISQLALTRAQGGRLPDPGHSPQQLARELLLGEWDGRPWADGFVVRDYAEIHNHLLRELFTDWRDEGDAHAVRFEDLVAAPGPVLQGVLDFLGVPVSARRIRKVLASINFRNLSRGRRPGEMDPASHYRQGLSGEWRSVFSPADIAAMRPRYAAAFAAAGYDL